MSGSDGGEDLRCSAVTQKLGERTAGSAGTDHRFLLIELPYPWPNKIDSHPLLAGLDHSLTDPNGATTRILGIHDGAAMNDAHRVIVYHREPDAAFTAFSRAHTIVQTADLVDLIHEVTVGDLSRLTPDDDQRDLLLCTHGSRDRCCGSLGTLLHIEIGALVADRERLHLWRSSHTGGHRFAPTALTFPDGMSWAYLDAEAVEGIIDRSIEPAALGRHVRGCVGLDSAPEQIADCIGFHEHGWSWLDQQRAFERRDNSDGSFTIAGCGLEVDLVQGESVPVPICGESIDQSIKATKSYDVSAIR